GHGQGVLLPGAQQCLAESPALLPGTDQEHAPGGQYRPHAQRLGPALPFGQDGHRPVGGPDGEGDGHDAVVIGFAHLVAGIGEHAQHAAVLRQYIGPEAAHAQFPAGCGQMLQQHRTQALALDPVSHVEGDLGLSPADLVEAAHGRDLFLPGDHQGHPLLVVHVREPVQVAVRDAAQRCEEPQVDRLLGLFAVEVLQRLGVLGQDRADPHGRPVPQDDIGLPVLGIGRLVLRVGRAERRHATILDARPRCVLSPLRGGIGYNVAMPRRRSSGATAPADESTILDTDVSAEMRSSYLEYAYSVIYSRAIPDARDGLKPVQRRILFQMAQMGLRPDRGHVKSARVVGEVMGKLHPHGDAAIYDALVRMAQPFSLRLPLVDGHGNVGSLDDGPAAPRYTEARLAPAAMVMTADLDEDVVDFVPNYDNQFTPPVVLPSALPNLLVNGASGIAVGMATNMAPHNLVEVISAARHLIDHPEATLEELMRFVPGPDLPSGGKIVGLDGIREAYAGGRGSFRTRATARIERITARKQGIVVTELPYQVGPERVIERIKDA